MNQFAQIQHLVGNTPLLEIECLFLGKKKRVFAKLESFNLTGSIKDRMAYYVLQQAYKKQQIKAGDYIVEATSGNTGIAFAALGAILDHKVIIYMPDWMSEERKKLIRSFGAEIRLVSREEGGFLGSIAFSEQFKAEHGNVYLPCQFANELNSDAHYYGIGQELVDNLKQLDLTIDGFVAGVGTGGTVMGVGRKLKEINPNAKAYPLEPLCSPTLSTGYKVGKHRIEGISDEFIPDIVKLNELDDVIGIDDGDAIIMAQKLAQKSISVGISSGANLLGALVALEKLGDDAIVTTVFPDDNKKYLSTDLMQNLDIKAEYMAPNVEIVNIKCHRSYVG